MSLKIEIIDAIANSTTAAEDGVKEATEAFAAVENLLSSPDEVSEEHFKIAMTQLSFALERASLQHKVLRLEIAAVQRNLRALNDAQGNFGDYELGKKLSDKVVYKLKYSERVGQKPHFISPDFHERRAKSAFYFSGPVAHEEAAGLSDSSQLMRE